MSSAQFIVDCTKMTRGYSEKLVAGIRPEMAARKPRWGFDGNEIDTNHATFICGHLAIYPARIYTLAGKDPKPVAVDPALEAIFKAGATCVDDPHGSVYPHWEKVVSLFFSGYDKAIEVASKMDDKLLSTPHPDAKVRERFPTIGAATNFLLNNHVMMHMGQLSAWRRAMGLPSAM
ncbi:MAG: DinB family protein [Phycisphaerales bacterium]